MLSLAQVFDLGLEMEGFSSLRPWKDLLRAACSSTWQSAPKRREPATLITHQQKPCFRATSLGRKQTETLQGQVAGGTRAGAKKTPKKPVISLRSKTGILLLEPPGNAALRKSHVGLTPSWPCAGKKKKTSPAEQGQV